MDLSPGTVTSPPIDLAGSIISRIKLQVNVAHALMRATSPLLATPGESLTTRHASAECRRGKHECLLHGCAGAYRRPNGVLGNSRRRRRIKAIHADRPIASSHARFTASGWPDWKGYPEEKCGPN